MWYLYVLRCGDDSLYTGATDDVIRRLATHAAGRGARYTRSRGPLTLLAAWRYPDRSAALRAEAQFKRLPRATKLTWIAGRWPFAGGGFAFDVLGELSEEHFCSRCGGLLMDIEGGSRVCSVCGCRPSPNPSPRVGILILEDEQVLLMRRRTAPDQESWDIPGGFLREGEHPEAGACREAREAVGVEIRLTGVLGFYMDGAIDPGRHPLILNIYFTAEARGNLPAGVAGDSWGRFPLSALPEAIARVHERQVLEDLRRQVAEIKRSQ